MNKERKPDQDPYIEKRIRIAERNMQLSSAGFSLAAVVKEIVDSSVVGIDEQSLPAAYFDAEGRRITPLADVEWGKVEIPTSDEEAGEGDFHDSID